MVIRNRKNGFSVAAWVGDAKTLLAFDLPQVDTKDLAGFTVRVTPGGGPSYYLSNFLRFEHPELHSQDPAYPAESTVNSPLHKFRWVHVPGLAHQGREPFYGDYFYEVTPRSVDANGSLQALDATRTVAVTVPVGPFCDGRLEVGFTRGFTQSQAFTHHFGKDAKIEPKHDDLVFDTGAQAGTDPQGQPYTWEDAYTWLGFTARPKIFGLLDAVIADAALRADVFAYDLNEPGTCRRLLDLAAQGRVRIILDNAGLHHNAAGTKKEDRFEAAFLQCAKAPAAIMRGNFSRYAHDKVFIVSDATGPRKVLTGSTNFSTTGLYVNSNHVLVFNDPGVAACFAEAFETAWSGHVSGPAFSAAPIASKRWNFGPSATLPATEITFSPHKTAFAKEILDGMTARVTTETGSVLFAVMGLDGTSGSLTPALQALHDNPKVFSFGISDTPGGIALYAPGRPTGLLVTGKPGPSRLPPPFSAVRDVGLGHQVHHKFVVCGFSGPDPVVYCGSSNLALGGEQQNGDNLLAIRDADVATAFAIEAVALVDHFNFLGAAAEAAKANGTEVADTPAKTEAAAQAGWFLSTSPRWAKAYYDPEDLRCADRLLFA